MTTFTQWLAEHRSGVADADITEALRTVAADVLRTGKAGTLTLTFKLSPQGDMLAISDTLAVKRPAEDTTKLYWTDLEGNLTRNNPIQPRLPLGAEDGGR